MNASPSPNTGREPGPGRDGILDAAAELFVTDGYAPTSLRAIAARAGIRAASVYHHFASKEALLEAVLARGIDVMHVAFDDAVAATEAAEATGRDRLAVHVQRHLQALTRHAPFTTAHLTTFHSAPPAVRSIIVGHRDRYEARWADLLAAMAASGELRPDLDPRLVRLLLFGALNSTAEWFDPAGRISLDQLTSTIVDQTWSGLSPVRTTT